LGFFFATKENRHYLKRSNKSAPIEFSYIASTPANMTDLTQYKLFNFVEKITKVVTAIKTNMK